MKILNENDRFPEKVIEMANHLKSIKKSEGINIGELQHQSKDSDFKINVRFSKGYGLIISDDTISDFARGHISVIDALNKSQFVKFNE